MIASLSSVPMHRDYIQCKIRECLARTEAMRSVSADYEVSILARVLANDQDELPADMARYLLTLAFNSRDTERMHNLAVRNQADSLSAEEKEELAAYARTGTVLSILKSKARRVLKVKPKKHVIG